MSPPPNDWTALLSHLSHELRTPLSVAQGYARMLESGRYGPLTDGQSRALAAMQRVHQQMQGLAEQLSLLAKLERGEAQPARERVALDALLDTIAAQHTPLPDHPVRVERVAPPPAEPPLTLQADPTHLTRALTALVAAVVRTAPEESTVAVAARPEPTGAQVTIGIALADRLDELYGARADDLAPLPDYEAGLGFGLALARRLLAAAGGLASTHRAGDGVLAVRVDLPLSS